MDKNTETIMNGYLGNIEDAEERRRGKIASHADSTSYIFPEGPSSEPGALYTVRIELYNTRDVDDMALCLFDDIEFALTGAAIVKAEIILDEDELVHDEVSCGLRLHLA